MIGLMQTWGDYAAGGGPGLLWLPRLRWLGRFVILTNILRCFSTSAIDLNISFTGGQSCNQHVS